MVREAPITAEELMGQLEADPVWVAHRDARDRVRAEREQQSQRDQVDLLTDLAAVGITVANVWDLVNTATPYPRALPVLLDHLLRAYPDRTRDGVARALAVKEARPIAWDTLVRLIRSKSLPEETASGVMIAVCAMAGSADVPVLIDLLGDRSIGRTRVHLVRKLMRSKRPEARQALLHHRADPDLQKEISARLGTQAA